MPNKHSKRYSTSYVIRGRQIKRTIRYHYTPVYYTLRLVFRIDNAKYCREGEAVGILTHCWWGCETELSRWKTAWQFLARLNILLPCVCVCQSRFSHIWLCVTPWTAARQAPLSMGVFQARILEWAALSSSRWSSSAKNKYAIKPWKDMEEPSLSSIKWKKPIWKRLHTVWFQLCDFLEKAMLWRQRKIRYFRGLGVEGWIGRAERIYPWVQTVYFLGFLGGSDGKESTCQCRRLGFNSWVRNIPWRRKWPPTPVFLPGKSHG